MLTKERPHRARGVEVYSTLYGRFTFGGDWESCTGRSETGLPLLLFLMHVTVKGWVYGPHVSLYWLDRPLVRLPDCWGSYIKILFPWFDHWPDSVLFMFPCCDPSTVCLGIISELVFNQAELEAHLFLFLGLLTVRGVWASSFPSSTWFSAHRVQIVLGKMDNFPEWKQQDTD